MLYKDFRPEVWNEIFGQDEIVSQLKQIISRTKKNKEKLPDMMFIGNSGCGKTTTVYAVAREFFGDDWKDHVLEANASDERGINFVREKLKNLAKIRGYRIVLLDEFDNFTDDAQMAMRRVMETSDTVTFIMTVNHPWKIIDAIHSRCVEFVFKQLSPSEMRKALGQVLKKKGISFDSLKIDEKQSVMMGLDSLIQESNGDMRKCLTMLEKILSDKNTIISPKEVQKVKQSETVPQILRLAYSGDFDGAKQLLEDTFILSGFNKDRIIEEFYRAIGTEIQDKERRVRLFGKLAEVENSLRHGNSPIIQLVGFLSFVWISPHLANSIVVRQ